MNSSLTALLLAAQAIGTPQITNRQPVPYIGVHSIERLQTLPTLISRSEPKLEAYLKKHHLQSSGPLFIRFLRIDRKNNINLSVGLPVKNIAPADGEVLPGVLPPGKYVSVKHSGGFSGMTAANATLQKWAFTHGHPFQMRLSRRGALFACWLETFKNDPSKSKSWQAEIAYRVTK